MAKEGGVCIPVTKWLICFQCSFWNATHKLTTWAFNCFIYFLKLIGKTGEFVCHAVIYIEALAETFLTRSLLAVSWLCWYLSPASSRRCKLVLPIPTSNAASLPSTSADELHCECYNTWSEPKCVGDKVQHGCLIKRGGDSLCSSVPCDPFFLVHIGLSVFKVFTPLPGSSVKIVWSSHTVLPSANRTLWKPQFLPL